jgi:hypothetical protein
VHFESADFFFDLAQTEALVEELAKDPFIRQIPKMVIARVDEIPNAAFLKKVAQAGIDVIAYGIESFNDTVLKNIGKETTGEQNIRALNWTLEAGIKPGLNLILYTPWDSVDSTLDTIEKSLVFMEKGAYINVVPFMASGFGRPLSRRDDILEYEVFDFPGLKQPFRFPRRAKVLDNDLSRVADEAMDQLYSIIDGMADQYPAWVESSVTNYALLIYKSFLQALLLDAEIPQQEQAMELLAQVDQAIQRNLRAESVSMLADDDPAARGVLLDRANPYNQLLMQVELKTEDGRNVILQFEDAYPYIPEGQQLPSTMIYNIQLVESDGSSAYRGYLRIETDAQDRVVGTDTNFRNTQAADAFVSRAINDFIDQAENNPEQALLNPAADWEKVAIEDLQSLNDVLSGIPAGHDH